MRLSKFSGNARNSGNPKLNQRDTTPVIRAPGARTISGIRQIIFPPRPRAFRHRRLLCIGMRSMHILATGVLLGGYIFNQPAQLLEPWLLATVITGVLLLAIDLHASTVVLFEARGVLLIVKLLLLLLLPLMWDLRIPILITVLFIGAVGSHMPKHLRHKVLVFKKLFSE